MSFLLDTNIVSEVRKGERCNANVRAWWKSVDDSELYLSVLVMGEIRKGIELVRPKDRAKTRALEVWLTQIERQFAARILPIDQQIAEVWGRISAIRPTPVVDGILAATAQVRQLTLVTRNDRDVVDLGARVLNPFVAAAD